MKKKIKWVDEFEGLDKNSEIKIIHDFLPSPQELAGKAETVRVTLELNRKDVEFFRKQAKKLGAPYQRMIRNLVSRYAREFQENN